MFQARPGSTATLHLKTKKKSSLLLENGEKMTLFLSQVGKSTDTEGTPRMSQDGWVVASPADPMCAPLTRESGSVWFVCLGASSRDACNPTSLCPQQRAPGKVLFDAVCNHLNLVEGDYFGLEFPDHRKIVVGDRRGARFIVALHLFIFRVGGVAASL